MNEPLAPPIEFDKSAFERMKEHLSSVGTVRFLVTVDAAGTSITMSVHLYDKDNPDHARVCMDAVGNLVRLNLKPLYSFHKGLAQISWTVSRR